MLLFVLIKVSNVLKSCYLNPVVRCQLANLIKEALHGEFVIDLYFEEERLKSRLKCLFTHIDQSNLTAQIILKQNNLVGSLILFILDVQHPPHKVDLLLDLLCP